MPDINSLVNEGVLDTIKGVAKTTGDYWGPKLNKVAKTTGDYWGPKLNKATNFVKDQVDARGKLASQSGVGGSLKHAGNELLAGARKHYGITAAIGAGALGAGYAAKKYLQRRKAKKAGRNV